ncbi:MAG: hypothetical protein PHU81_01435 [Acidobacteriota bacterium]|nr:hypothetical protein [Acidobacteriota bacterium]
MSSSLNPFHCYQELTQSSLSLATHRYHVRVLGIIRDEEIKNPDEISEITGARFPTKSFRKWKKYRPNYAPTLYGVGNDGKIYFVLACTGFEESYLRSYVDEFMRKADYLLSWPNIKDK